MNHLVWIVLDSCRFDSYERAETPNFDRIGVAEKRYSYASWTGPSHYAFLSGLMPHTSPPGVFASQVYVEDFKLWSTRLGVQAIEFADFVPELSLPRKLRHLGYTNVARVSLPVLNPKTLLSRYFHSYELMEGHNQFDKMIEEMIFPDDDPHFYLLNLGETHYPYMLEDEELPHISGVHGVFKRLDQFLLGEQDAGLYTAENFFTHLEMRRLHEQQVRTVEYCDRLFGQLLEKTPPSTYFIVCGDHGELFGEDGYFGHGPVMHPKVFEVPFLEGAR